MNKRRENTLNTYDNVNAPLGIELNSTTYTKLLDANPLRFDYKISNISQNTIFILEEIPPDNQDRGFTIYGRQNYEPKAGQCPIGEVHAKAETGNPTILIVEV